MSTESYLQQRQSERRWRVVTALVIAGAMAAGALWTLARHGEPQGTPSSGEARTVQSNAPLDQNRK